MRNARLAFIALILLSACGGNESTGPSGPPAVAQVTVTLSTSSVIVGSTVQATAVVLDGQGNTLPDRTVTWGTSNGLLATVSSAGTVTTVAPGTVSITATADGKSGSSQLTVTQPPVTQVTLFGSSRVKVGDSYNYTVEARLADGTLVQRPLTWSVVETGKATLTVNGTMVPLQSGSITLRATVDGVVGTGAITAYDWSDTGPGSTRVIYLPADNTITNKYGTAEYPTLGIGCSSGTFAMYVSTNNFVTQSGLVAYSFDGGNPLTQTWLEFSNFSSLGHPGPTNLATKNFVLTIANAHIFALAFTEYNASAKAMSFRVTGLANALTPILNACPSNAIMEPDHDARPWYDRLPPSIMGPVPMTPDRLQRLNGGAR